MPYTDVVADRKNFTFYLDKTLIELSAQRAKVENRSANRMVEVMIADYLRRHGVDLGPEYPDPGKP